MTDLAALQKRRDTALEAAKKILGDARREGRNELSATQDRAYRANMAMMRGTQAEIVSLRERVR